MTDSVQDKTPGPLTEDEQIQRDLHSLYDLFKHLKPDNPPVAVSVPKLKRMCAYIEAARMTRISISAARDAIREHFGENLSWLDNDLARAVVVMRETIAKQEEIIEAYRTKAEPTK